MSHIDTVFFDWGGVIANDPGPDFLSQLLRDIGASEQQVEEIYTTYMRRFMRGEISERAYWEELRNNYGFSIHDSISDEFQKWRGLVKNDDVFALVDAAKAKGMQTAILSNLIEPTYNVLQQAGYFERFDKVIASCKVGYAKPQEEIYRIALKELNTTAERSIFIDDKQINLDPADKMGFTTILAQNPAQIITDMTRCLEI